LKSSLQKKPQQKKNEIDHLMFSCFVDFWSSDEYYQLSNT